MDVPRLASRLLLRIGQSVSEICDMPIRKIAGRLTRSAAHSVFYCFSSFPTHVTLGARDVSLLCIVVF